MDVDDGEKKKKKKKKKTVRKISNRSNFEINLFMRTRLLTLLREYKMINFLQKSESEDVKTEPAEEESMEAESGEKKKKKKKKKKVEASDEE